MAAKKGQPSLEALVERGDITLEVLHPGGLAITGELARLFLRVLGTWGLQGLWDTLASERIFRSRHLGYGIIVGKKPEGRI